MKKCGCLFDYVSNHNIKELKNMAKDFILDKDYILKDNRAWLEVDNFSIRIAKINSGLTIKVFKNGEEGTETLDELFVHNLEEEDEQEGINMTKQELIERVEIIIEAHKNNKYVSTTDLMVMIIKVMEGNKKCQVL